jgi:hypothetical protein
MCVQIHALVLASEVGTHVVTHDLRMEVVVMVVMRVMVVMVVMVMVVMVVMVMVKEMWWR